MKIFLIVVKRAFAQLQNRLEQKIVCFDINEPCYYWRDCGKSGKVLYLLPRLPEAESPGAIESFISSLISHFITSDLTDLLLQDILRYNYFYFSKEERAEILLQMRHNLEKGIAGQCRDTFGEIIERKIREYLLSQDQHINIEGFIYFRLQDYQAELKRIVDDAVENFLTEKEYREFVRLLKYFLEIQQPKIDMVHLAVDEQGQFQITDQRFIKIDPREWEEFNLDDFEGDSDYEDLLVSMLVSVAPRRIMLHQNVMPRYPKTVDNLRRIFDDRLLLCNNCTHCRQKVMQLAGSDKTKG